VVGAGPGLVLIEAMSHGFDLLDAFGLEGGEFFIIQLGGVYFFKVVLGDLEVSLEVLVGALLAHDEVLERRVAWDDLFS
jgi:hypothetical protein